MFKPHQADMLQDLRIYIHQEPDQGGETFLRKVVTGLREGGFIGEVYRWSCSTIHCKDPSEVYIKFGKEQGGKKILALIKKAEKIDLDEPEPIPEAIKGAPVALRQPEGWIYSEKGISHIDEKTYSPKLVCRTPIILTQRLRSIETGEEKMEIAFKRDGEWKKAIFPRSTIFTARSITAAPMGWGPIWAPMRHPILYIGTAALWPILARPWQIFSWKALPSSWS